LVPSGLTTGASSTCRRISSEGMSLSDIAITFSVSMTISYWHPALLVLNISLVTEKNSSHHLNPCMLLFSDFAGHLIKQPRSNLTLSHFFHTSTMHGQTVEHVIYIFQVGVYNISNCKSAFWHRPIRQRYHYLDRNVAPVSIKQ
jgi:hypothetical protein